MNFWKFNFKKGAGVWVIKKNPNPLKNPQSQLTKQKEKKNKNKNQSKTTTTKNALPNEQFLFCSNEQEQP